MRKVHAEVGATSSNKQSTIEMHLIFNKGIGVAMIAVARFAEEVMSMADRSEDPIDLCNIVSAKQKRQNMNAEGAT